MWHHIVNKVRGLHQDEGGQAIVFIALTILAMVVFVMLIMNTGDAVSGKVQMVNASDAAVVTGATWMARGLNTAAIINKTMAYILSAIIVTEAMNKTHQIAALILYGQFWTAKAIEKTPAAFVGVLLEVQTQACYLAVYGGFRGETGEFHGLPYPEFGAEADIPKNFSIDGLYTYLIRHFRDPMWKVLKSLSDTNDNLKKVIPWVAQIEAYRMGYTNGASLAFMVPTLPSSEKCEQGKLCLPIEKSQKFKDICDPVIDAMYLEPLSSVSSQREPIYHFPQTHQPDQYDDLPIPLSHDEKHEWADFGSFEYIRQYTPYEFLVVLVDLPPFLRWINRASMNYVINDVCDREMPDLGKMKQEINMPGELCYQMEKTDEYENPFSDILKRKYYYTEYKWAASAMLRDMLYEDNGSRMYDSIFQGKYSTCVDQYGNPTNTTCNEYSSTSTDYTRPDALHPYCEDNYRACNEEDANLHVRGEQYDDPIVKKEMYTHALVATSGMEYDENDIGSMKPEDIWEPPQDGDEEDWQLGEAKADVGSTVDECKCIDYNSRKNILQYSKSNHVYSEKVDNGNFVFFGRAEEEQSNGGIPWDIVGYGEYQWGDGRVERYPFWTEVEEMDPQCYLEIEEVLQNNPRDCCGTCVWVKDGCTRYEYNNEGERIEIPYDCFLWEEETPTPWYKATLSTLDSCRYKVHATSEEMAKYSEIVRQYYMKKGNVHDAGIGVDVGLDDILKNEGMNALQKIGSKYDPDPWGTFFRMKEEEAIAKSNEPYVDEDHPEHQDHEVRVQQLQWDQNNDWTNYTTYFGVGYQFPHDTAYRLKSKSVFDAASIGILGYGSAKVYIPEGVPQNLFSQEWRSRLVPVDLTADENQAAMGLSQDGLGEIGGEFKELDFAGFFENEDQESLIEEDHPAFSLIGMWNEATRWLIHH